MADISKDTPVKSLDGTIQPLNGSLASAPKSSSNASLEQKLPSRPKPNRTVSSKKSLPRPGQILTGRQEHCQLSVHGGSYTTNKLPIDLKRELISQQVTYEISELASTTALQRFGAPFKSEYGEVAPVDSDLPLLRYIFVHHVRNFPFLDQAREKEFWQDKLQVVRSD